MKGKDIVCFKDCHIFHMVTTIRENFIVNFELFVILFIILVLISSSWEHGKKAFD